MSHTPTLSTRPASHTIAREAPYTLAAVEEAANRLRSWAVIMGVPITGRPFVRLNSDLTAFVHLPVDRAVDTTREDSMISGVISPGEVMEFPAVPFDDIRPDAVSTKADLPESCELAGPVEYHAGPGGLRSGALVAPVHRLAASAAA